MNARMLTGNNTPWGTGGIESFSEGEELPQHTVSRQRLSQLRYPERHNARLAVQYALKTGKLAKPTKCSNCGKEAKLSAHHHKGYAPIFYLDVIWLCSTCHGIANRKPAKPKPTKQYQSEISASAAALGKLGGKVRSPAKAAAARKNGKKGGRPKKPKLPL